MSDATLHVALVRPEIAPNTGSVGRLCVAVDATLHVVHPIGFRMDEKAVRRAGLDYWRHVRLVEHENEEAFWRWVEGRRFHVFSSHGRTGLSACDFRSGDVLVFGPESVGLRPEVVAARGGGVRIPMAPGPIRSLNLANAVSVVVYRALERIGPAWFA